MQNNGTMTIMFAVAAERPRGQTLHSLVSIFDWFNQKSINFLMWNNAVSPAPYSEQRRWLSSFLLGEYRPGRAVSHPPLLTAYILTSRRPVRPNRELQVGALYRWMKHCDFFCMEECRLFTHLVVIILIPQLFCLCYLPKQARREEDTISGSPVSQLPGLITIKQPTHRVINLLQQRGMC